MKNADGLIFCFLFLFLLIVNMIRYDGFECHLLMILADIGLVLSCILIRMKKE